MGSGRLSVDSKKNGLIVYGKVLNENTPIRGGCSFVFSFLVSIWWVQSFEVGIYTRIPDMYPARHIRLRL